ncbi:MAG: hypothetical protein AAF988_08070 [Pseudomonadota bacterium]
MKLRNQLFSWVLASVHLFLGSSGADAEEGYTYQDPFGEMVTSEVLSRSALKNVGYTPVYCDEASARMAPYRQRKIIRGDTPSLVRISQQQRKSYYDFSCTFSPNQSYESVQRILGLDGMGSNKLLVIFNSSENCLKNNDSNYWDRNIDYDLPGAYVKGPLHRADKETLLRVGCFALG